MDNRYIVILIMTVMLGLLVAILIWMYRSKQKLLRWQKEAEDELSIQKKMLEDVRAEMERLKGPDVTDNRFADTGMIDLITGVAPVDRLLQKKQQQCQACGVEFTCRIGNWPAKALGSESMVRLLGNLLDNAIEAALKADAGKKSIVLESRIVKGQWALSVTNSKSSADHPLENQMQTTKPDAEGHGMGTQIIDKIVRKADGSVKRTDEGDHFKVLITMPA